MKKVSRFGIILYGLCAVIWTIKAILEVAHQTYYDSAFSFMLNVLCAVLWIAVFIVNLKRYRSDKDKFVE